MNNAAVERIAESRVLTADFNQCFRPFATLKPWND